MERVFRFKREIAVVMAFLVAFTFSMSGVRVDAAEKNGPTYIKDFKLYIIENPSSTKVFKEEEAADEAREWFEDNKYTMIEGNLNAEASGALKKEVGVYLGYSTTTEKSEAVTDLAVINERGNYSQAEYKRILEEQKKMYADMVSDLKDMLEEYRKNVNNGVATAIQSRDFMNRYKDDDSGKLLGDLLMDISDEDLSKLLMQANGQVVLMIEDRLSYACDAGKTNWLDRMSKLGSYKNLEKKALKACNNDINKARKTLDKKYKEDAITLSENWNDMRQHFESILKKISDWNVSDMSEDELEKFLEENKDNLDVETFQKEYRIVSALAAYPYEGESLAYYFSKPADEFKGDGIRKLYPLVASLTQGQVSSVDQTVSLFTLVVNALSAAVFNDMETGNTKEMMDKLDEEDKEILKEARENVEETLDEWEGMEGISIYEGVDRELFENGVAVTSTARSYSNGDGVTWADKLMGSSRSWQTVAGVAGGAVVFGVAAYVMGTLANKTRDTIYNTTRWADDFISKQLKYDKALFDAKHSLMEKIHNLNNNTTTRSMQGINVVEANVKAVEKEIVKSKEKIGNILENSRFQSLDGSGDVIVDLNKNLNQQSFSTEWALMEKAKENNLVSEKMVSRYQTQVKLMIGFTIVAVVLAVADIVTTSITLYKYYNREHLPVPGHMVDMAYNNEKETSFVNYANVPDQKGNPGDVNGGAGKQWLALYQSHDEDAGEPLLAPENGEEYKVIVQYGSDDEPQTNGYSPLHMFGSPNAAQNLTFADGESGWSYNDGKKGTYVFFRRGTDVATGSETEDESEDSESADQAVSGSAADAGSALSSGSIVLIGAGCGLVGIFIGAFGMTLVRRKKRL